MPKECAHTHAGLQHIAAYAAHACQRAVHGMDDGRRGIKRCQRGFLRGGVFLRRQQFFQLRLVEVYFHEAVKIEIGEHHLVQIIE